ncbi:MAG: Unknown protein [uncultured Thiotrichaceae bacterium]|uniref:Uncharacterized protein n=1 Tax=uncultured Thiotrichaceae bacterium TaxID=298394 RepID=A0A6S6SI30_9GAMM|nr:MAG: Unknown protein [uncultured Thiotrichaceae bacterium]
MSEQQKPQGTSQAENSKTFCALNIFKWVAMLLMFSIAFGEFYMRSADDVNWVFIGFCVVFGLLLLWVGHILAQHSIAADQAYRRSKSAKRKVKRSHS